MGNKVSGWIEKLWDLFSSMKLGLFLLGIIALIAGIGTIFPQVSEDPAKAETVGKVWQVLGFTHLYSTSWFRLLLGLLCINLVVCSVQRFQGIYVRTFKPQPPPDPINVPQKVRREISGSSIALRQMVESTLHSKRFYLVTKETEKGWSFIALKRRWGNWGSLFTHIAFVVLVIGALIGMLFGFKGNLMALVGSTTPIQKIEVSKGRIPQDFSVKINSFEPRFLANGDRENWYTDLSIIENAKETARQTISTNHPFTYHGTTFYQSSWAIGLTIEMNGQVFPASLYEGESTGLFQLPGTDMYMNIIVGQNLRKPVVSYQVSQGYKQIQEGQVAAGQTVDIQGKCKLTVDGWITGLQVKQDPGVPVIWLGSALLIFGLFLSFYWRPLTVSGIVENTDGSTGKLTIGIISGKLAERAGQELEELTENILTGVGKLS